MTESSDNLPIVCRNLPIKGVLSTPRRGGRMIIGVSDHGAVVGLSAADVRRINQLVSNTATNLVRPLINPITENISVGDALVMVVDVREGVSKPYADNTGVSRARG